MNKRTYLSHTDRALKEKTMRLNIKIFQFNWSNKNKMVETDDKHIQGFTVSFIGRNISQN